MSEPDYPRFLQELLSSCPEAGDGVHPWLFKVARYLHRYHEPEEICAILEARVIACGRELEPHEIPDAVRNSGACKWEPSGESASERRAAWLLKPTTSRVPEFKPTLAIETAARIPIDITPEWLKSRSPFPVDCSSGEFLESIFKPDEKAVVFCRYKSQGQVTARSRWRLAWPTPETGRTIRPVGAGRLEEARLARPIDRSLP